MGSVRYPPRKLNNIKQEFLAYPGALMSQKDRIFQPADIRLIRWHQLSRAPDHQKVPAVLKYKQETSRGPGPEWSACRRAGPR